MRQKVWSSLQDNTIMSFYCKTKKVTSNYKQRPTGCTTCSFDNSGWQRGSTWLVMRPKLSAWCVIGPKLASWGVIGHNRRDLLYFHNPSSVIFLLGFRDWWISFETRSTGIKTNSHQIIFWSFSRSSRIQVNMVKVWTTPDSREPFCTIEGQFN